MFAGQDDGATGGTGFIENYIVDDSGLTRANGSRGTIGSIDRKIECEREKMIMRIVLSGQALRDARWVQSFGAGTQWLDGPGSGFRARRLAQFKDLGVFLPHPDKVGMLIIGQFHLIEVN